MSPPDLLLRQVHPTFYYEDWISSQAFRLTAKDEGHLSTYDGRNVSAQESFDHYRKELDLEAVGTVSVTASECKSEALGVKYDGKDFLSHVSIDFNGHKVNRWKTISKRLKKYAELRGWLVGPME